jgi:8-oxo-dGTP pyrophosphatase MutT (NUDIX family)
MTEDLLCATVSVRGVISDTNGRVLLVQRRTDGTWELPGGRLSREESPGAGLRREINEETGLSVTIVDVLKANSWVNSAGKDRFAVHYDCEPTSETVELSDEHVDSAWVAPTEATQRLCEPQAAAVRRTTGSTDPGTDITDTSSLTQG